jgi:hypothetical protein
MIYCDSHLIDAAIDQPEHEACQNLGMEALSLVEQAIQKGIKDGSIRSDIEPAKTALILWGHSTGILQLIATKGEHLREKHDLAGFNDFDEIIDYSYKLIKDTLRK